MNLIRELESVGYELRLEGQCYSVLNRDGQEVIRLPLDAVERGDEVAAPRTTDWVSVLPADLLQRD